MITILAPATRPPVTSTVWLSKGSVRTGRGGERLCLALERMGVPVKVIPHRVMDIDADLVPEERYEQVSKWISAPIGLGELLIVVMPPMECAQMRGLGRRLVGYTTHECDRVSAEAAACAAGLDMLWAQSAFAASAYEKAGVPRSQIRVLDPPLVGGPWEARVTARVPRVSEQHPYRFGMVGQWIPRKGFDSLIRAYYTAFAGNEPVRLCIRTSPFGSMSISEFDRVVTARVHQIRSEWAGRTAFPRISIETGTEARDQELIDWVGQLDCYVNSSFGEGVGVPQAYALAQGVPMITTGFGAVGGTYTEVVADLLPSYQLLDHRMVPIDREQLRVNRIYDYRQEWGSYDVAQLAQFMKADFARGPERWPEVAARAREKFGIARFEAQMRQLLREVLTDEMYARLVCR